MHQGKNRTVVVVSAAAFLLIVKVAFRLVISFVCVLGLIKVTGYIHIDKNLF